VAAAASGLQAARGRAGVLTGGRLTLEDAYGYAKFARLALGSNDIDMRARPHSAEEAQFLADHVAGRGVGVSYADLERAPAVLLAGFEPEDESPIVFLRLRKAVRKHGLAVYSLAALASPGLGRLSGVLLPAVPGEETATLNALADEAGEGMPAATAGSLARADGKGAPGGEASRSGGPGVIPGASTALHGDGAIILAGERLAEVPGALSAAARLAEVTGAKLAWIPRRAGERGAIEAGALPGLLPGGRQVTDPEARAEVARAWGVGSLPGEPGRDTGQILAAAAAGQVEALVIAGVDPADLPDPAAALEAMAVTPFIVSLELRASAVTDRADVVLPVAAVAEKAGTFVNWEGRPGSFAAALQVPAVQADLQVLGEIADAMDVHLGLPGTAAARAELAGLAPAVAVAAARPGAPAGNAATQPGAPRPSAIASRPAAPQPAVTGQIGHLGRAHPGPGAAVLATWHQLLDAGRLQDGEPNLAGTARAAAAVMSAATAAEAGTGDGGKVTVATSRGAITVPVRTADMPDRVVWLPANSAGCAVRGELGAGHGGLVMVRRAE